MAPFEVAIQKHSEDGARHTKHSDDVANRCSGMEDYRVVKERDALAGSDSGLFGEIRSVEDENIDDNYDGLDGAGEGLSDVGAELDPYDSAGKQSKHGKNGSRFPILDGGQVVDFAFRSRA